MPAAPFTEACACSLNVHSIIKPDLLSTPPSPPLLCISTSSRAPSPSFSLFTSFSLFSPLSLSIYSGSSITHMRADSSGSLQWSSVWIGHISVFSCCTTSFDFFGCSIKICQPNDYWIIYLSHSSMNLHRRSLPRTSPLFQTYCQLHVSRLPRRNSQDYHLMSPAESIRWPHYCMQTAANPLVTAANGFHDLWRWERLLLLSPPLSLQNTQESVRSDGIGCSMFDSRLFFWFNVKVSSFFLLLHFQLESGELPQEVVYQIYFIYILGGRQDYSILIPFLC